MTRLGRKAFIKYRSLRTPFWNEITVVPGPTIGLISAMSRRPPSCEDKAAAGFERGSKRNIFARCFPLYGQLRGARRAKSRGPTIAADQSSGRRRHEETKMTDYRFGACAGRSESSGE